MERVTVELDTREIEKALERISPVEQKRLEGKLWTLCMDGITAKMRKNARKNRATDREIGQICEDVRQEMHEEKTKSRS